MVGGATVGGRGPVCAVGVITDVWSETPEGTGSVFGNSGSVGVGNVDCEDMGVGTVSSSGAVELPLLKVRSKPRFLGRSRSPPKRQSSSTSGTSSTVGWRFNVLDAGSGSAVRARLNGGLGKVSSALGRLRGGVDWGRGGTSFAVRSSLGRSFGGVLLPFWEVRAGEAGRDRRIGEAALLARDRLGGVNRG
jgi:hypothetical protein